MLLFLFVLSLAQCSLKNAHDGNSYVLPFFQKEKNTSSGLPLCCLITLLFKLFITQLTRADVVLHMDMDRSVIRHIDSGEQYGRPRHDEQCRVI